MPWALDMANICLDGYGNFHLLPRPGGWHEQDAFELEALQMAQRVQLMHPKDPKRRKFENEDPNFILWLNGDDEPGVEYVSQVWMENTAV